MLSHYQFFQFQWPITLETQMTRRGKEEALTGLGDFINSGARVRPRQSSSRRTPSLTHVVSQYTILNKYYKLILIILPQKELTAEEKLLA